jgi:Ca-activated chloride channel family protein
MISFLSLSLAVPSLIAQKQVQRRPIRVQSALVTIPVIVSDAHGRYVAGLSSEDFVLFQDDDQRPIDLFASAEEPIHLALLLDTSKSTILVLDKIKKAAEKFLRQLRNQDQAMVISFDTEIEILSTLTTDRSRLEKAIRQVEVDGGNYTKLRDAVFEVVRQFQSVQGRKAAVLLSDGLDFGSQTSVAELFDHLAQSDLVLYSVYYDVDPRDLMKKLFGVSSRIPRNKSRPPTNPDPEARDFEREGVDFMQKLSQETVGHFYDGGLKKLNQTLGKVLEELRQQYLLGFYPEEAKLDGELHTLRIEVSRPDAIVRGRSRYRATARARP